MDAQDFAEKNSTTTFLNSDWLYLSLIICQLLTYFHRTIFLGQNLSKIGQLSQLDYFQNPELKSSVDYSPFDPSIYTFTEPFRRLGHDLLFACKNPFWNPYSGCGHPLSSGPEMRFLSPFSLFFPADQYFYNLTMVTHIGLAQIGSYFLARNFNLSRPASLFTAFAYGLCPIAIWQTELSFETWAYPWVLLLFKIAFDKKGIQGTIFLALGSAFFVSNMHPECSLNIVTVSTLYIILQTKFSGGSLCGLLKILVPAALLGFCIAAPILFPFFEFACAASFFKENLVSIPLIPLHSLLVSICYPLTAGDSPYIGAIAVLLVPFAFGNCWRKHLALFLCAGFSLIVCTLPGPLSHLFLLKPLYLLEPIYFCQIFMLFLSLIAAIGLDRLIMNLNLRAIIVLFLMAALSNGLPLLLQINQTDLINWKWDGAMPPVRIAFKQILTDLLISLVFCGYALVAYLSKARPAPLLVAGILLNYLSLAMITRTTFPAFETFSWKATPTIAKIRSLNQRIVAVGNRMLKPSTTAAYQIKDVRLFHQFLPIGLTEYLQLASSGLTHSKYSFVDTASPFIDMASVKYIVARAPIAVSTELAELKKVLIKKPVKFAEGVQLLSFGAQLDENDKQLIGITNWKVPSQRSADLAVQNALIDKNGKDVWSSQEYPFEFFKVDCGNLTMPLLLPLPADFKTKQLTVTVRLVNRYSKAWSWPEPAEPFSFRPQIDLTALTELKSSNRNRAFRLAGEMPDGIRIYDNTMALPQAYFSSSSISANSVADATRTLREGHVDWHHSVVIEGIPRCTSVNSSDAKAEIVPIQVQRPNTSRVELEFSTDKSGYVILTDTYFPGWHAYLDNSEVKIHRANILFRAVSVTPGKHVLKFKYRPLSITLGCVLCAVALMLCVGGLVRRTNQ